MILAPILAAIEAIFKKIKNGLFGTKSGPGQKDAEGDRLLCDLPHLKNQDEGKKTKRKKKGSCFVADTLVKLSDRHERIQLLRTFERVLACS